MKIKLWVELDLTSDDGGKCTESQGSCFHGKRVLLVGKNTRLYLKCC